MFFIFNINEKTSTNTSYRLKKKKIIKKEIILADVY